MSESELEMIKDIKISTRRNLEGYALGPGLREDIDERAQIEKQIVEALDGLEGDYVGEYYPLSTSK